jgi:hypothetical protein
MKLWIMGGGENENAMLPFSIEPSKRLNALSLSLKSCPCEFKPLQNAIQYLGHQQLRERPRQDRDGTRDSPET